MEFCNSHTCVFGTCDNTSLANSTSSTICVCDTTFSGRRCNHRTSMVQWELLVAFFLFFILSLAIFVTQKQIIKWLVHSNKHRQKAFEFPRDHRSYNKDSIWKRWVHRLHGPVIQAPPLTKTAPVNAFTLLQWKVEFASSIIAIIFMGIEYVEYIAIAFLPLIPWQASAANSGEPIILQTWAKNLLLGSNDMSTTGVTNLPLVLPYYEFSHTAFYQSLSSIIILILIFFVVSRHKCVLLKPQPSSTSTEGISSLVFRFMTDLWAFPWLIQCFLPLRCVVLGYVPSASEGLAKSGFSFASYIQPPELEETCWTLDRLVITSVGFGAFCIFYLASLPAILQATSEGTHPKSVTYSDYRYVSRHWSLKVLLALSVAIFGATHPFVVTILALVMMIVELYWNIHWRPCMYTAINYIRTTCCILTIWSLSLAIVLVTLDYNQPTAWDDSSTAIFYLWWLVGAAIGGLCFVSLSGQFLFGKRRAKIAFEMYKLDKRVDRQISFRRKKKKGASAPSGLV